MISVRNVQHNYRHNGVVESVLHGVNLAVAEGEFVVLMGPSGCGKTTLLNILGLMMSPTSADSVALAGTETLGLSDSARTRLRRETLGFVFQRFNLLPTMSVRSNVALPLRIRGQHADGAVDKMLDRVGLLPQAGKKPGRLSIGQQQRVALARALIGRPAVLFADEPTGNLDSASAGAVLSLLREFHRDWGQTILLITHNEHLVGAGDRVLTMRDGRLHD
ncbi:MAG: ABC transporter ATP-binding protein [Phycisphaerae bacterium]|nr:ABC transporter ATP-binding protein [Phycisphaerae bacterium]